MPVLFMNLSDGQLWNNLAPTRDPSIRSKPQRGLRNIPPRQDRFVGRERELFETKRLLAGTSRCLTITGPGGCGKTRLATELADQLGSLYQDGAWFVDLSGLMDGSPITQTVAGLFGIQESAGTSLQQALLAHLRSRSLLLLLDNCEHVLAGARDFVTATLNHAPEIRILATSREQLGLERSAMVYDLTPLSVPPAIATEPETITSFESVALFRDPHLATPSLALNTMPDSLLTSVVVLMEYPLLSNSR